MYYLGTDKRGSYAHGEKIKKVRPQESNEYLHNPHKGLATFQHFNGDPLFPCTSWSEAGPLKFEFKKLKPEFHPKHPPSTTAYCRWFWQEAEPREGEYDFSMIENALKVCGLRGQTLQARIMPFGSKNQAQLPSWYREKFKTKLNPGGWYEPDYESADYLRCWGSLHKELGKRFGKNRLLDTYDAGYLGPWGEGNGKMSVRQIKKFAKMYTSCLPSAKVVGEFDGAQLGQIVSLKTGWRANCWGDMRNHGRKVVPDGLGWNHTYDAYPEHIIEAKAAEAWKNGPVLLETCWTPCAWYKEKMPLEYLDFVIQQALALHVTGINTKYSCIPRPYWSRFIAFTESMGYRFVLRYVKFENTLKHGNKFLYNAWIDNTGVAPIYRDLYAFAFRFTQGRKKVVVLSRQDIRKWLPGYSWIKETVALPQGFAKGEITVETAIVEKESLIPKIKFGIKGVGKDGWFRLETVAKRL